MNRNEDLDATLVEACQRGDREAFRRLVEACRERIYALAYHLARDEAAAKDVTQQVLLTLWTEIGRFRGESRFHTWLYRIVVNASLDERRRLRRLLPVGPGREPVERAQPDELCGRRERAAEVRAALSGLGPKLRVPLVLRHVEGLSYEEIAHVLGCSPGTVASRLSRGHRALARALAHLDPREENA